MHWAWHACNVLKPTWEHGVLAMQLLTQSEAVEQSMRSLLHVMPGHVATCAHAWSHDVPPLLELALALVALVAPPLPELVLVVVAVVAPPPPELVLVVVAVVAPPPPELVVAFVAPPPPELVVALVVVVLRVPPLPELALELLEEAVTVAPVWPGEPPLPFVVVPPPVKLLPQPAKPTTVTIADPVTAQA